MAFESELNTLLHEVVSRTHLRPAHHGLDIESFGARSR
jgi:hypothetical protein